MLHTASAPAFWNEAGGLMLWKAWANWLCVIEPEPEGSIWSNRLDIFWAGGIGALAPDQICADPTAMAVEGSMFMGLVDCLLVIDIDAGGRG